MALEEAHALTKSLLDETKDPDARAKLVALQLALGWPHALEVEPADLAELREHELAVSLPALRAQIWLGVAAVLALVWYLASAVAVATIGSDSVPGLVIVGSALMGFVHAAIAVGVANRRPTHDDTSLLNTLAATWLVAVLSSIAVGLFADEHIGVAFFAWTAPSMFVALAAWCVARHTARR